MPSESTNCPKSLTPEDLQAITPDQLTEAERAATSEYTVVSDSNNPVVKVAIFLREICNELGVPLDSPDIVEQLTKKVRARNDFDHWHAAVLEIEKIYSKQEMARLVHDLRGFLSVVFSCLDLLEQDEKFCPESEELVRDARSSAQRALTLADKMLDVSIANDRPNKKYCDVSRLIDSMANSPKYKCSNIRMVTDLDPACVTLADPMQMQRTVSNLLNNAVDAMPSGGTISITTSLEQADTPETQTYIKITIRDTGCGIPREDLTKIFGAHFTTKAEKNGTGMGLVNVKKIIEAHGGYISVKSRTGADSYTEFKIFLPKKSNGQPAAQTEYLHVLKPTSQ